MEPAQPDRASAHATDPPLALFAARAHNYGFGRFSMGKSADIIRSAITAVIVLGTFVPRQLPAEGSDTDEILARLRAFDSAFLRAHTVVVRQQTPPSRREGYQGAKVEKITFSSDNNTTAVLREISYISAPSFRAGHSRIDYDQNGRLVVWRTVRTLSLKEPDFQGFHEDRVLLLVSPEGDTVEKEAAPNIRLYQPTDYRRILHFKIPLWATGRGFADSLARIIEVRQQDDGLLAFRAEGTLAPGLEGSWQVSVDSNAGYLVRAASFTISGEDSPFLVYAGSGTKWYDTCCLAKQANLSYAPGFFEGDGVVSADVQDFSPQADAALFSEARAALRGRLPEGAQVVDWRSFPDEPVRFTVGEPLMSAQDQLDVVADAAAPTSQMSQADAEGLTTGSDGTDSPTIAAQTEANDPRPTPSRSDSAGGTTRYVIFAAAGALIAVLIIAGVRARRATKK